MLANILLFHILVALIMAGVAFRALFHVVRQQLSGLPNDAKSLAVLLIIEALSGALLGLLTPEFSAIRFCVNVGAYIGAFLLVEFIIFTALKKESVLVFPHAYVRASASISATTFAVVLLARAPFF